MEKKILVIGGAGYIGSHTVKKLLDNNCKVTVFDNLSTGNRTNLFNEVEFIEGDILNKSELEKCFLDNDFNAVIHFAALKAAGVSMVNPVSFAKTNIFGTINILEMMVKYKVMNLIFSSSAAVYGEPEYLPIDEKHPLKPINYYGYTKLVIEENLKWFSKIHNINYAALRYFNAAGYDINQTIKTPETEVLNLIPLIMQFFFKKRDCLNVFGNDYPTKDGTCIRDYIHVSDLAEAHYLALNYINEEKNNLTLNLGYGEGYSVLEVINELENLTNQKINYNITSRREGDPAKLISDYKKALQLLKWKPIYSDLKTIINTSYLTYKEFYNE